MSKEEQIISFETAKLAKEKSFNFPVLFAWIEILNKESSRFGETKCRQVNASQLFDNECYAPTQSLLQKWLREVHNLHIYIDTTPIFDSSERHRGKYKAIVKVPFQPFKWTTGQYYLGDTYEEALEKGLQEALKLIP